MNLHFDAWFGFWIFMAVFIACESWLYSKGHETFFHKHKTPEEKEIQRALIERLKTRRTESET
jgi:hypothetical protein